MNFRFPFHLRCAIYKPHRSEGSKPPGRSHDCWLGCCVSVLPYAQSSNQNILFYFPVSPVYLTQLIHISLQKVNVELQLLIILPTEEVVCGKAIDHRVTECFRLEGTRKTIKPHPSAMGRDMPHQLCFFPFRKTLFVDDWTVIFQDTYDDTDLQSHSYACCMFKKL